MTDEKDPKETPPVTPEQKDDASAKPAAEAKDEVKPAATEEAPKSVKPAAAEDVKPVALEEAPKSVKPVEEKPVKPVDGAPKEETAKEEAPRSVKPLATKSEAPAKSAAAAKSGVLNPEPGVRVRLAYRDGASIETPADPGRAGSGLKPRRLLAEYDTTTDVIHAAETLRDAGYKSFEAHTPFPVHGMDAAMGLADSRLGWIVLVCGLTGVTSAWVMMFWMNGIDYPLIIGGKPPDALPSMVPIMFELTVLLSAFGAVFGMFGLNRLPQHHDPIFYSDRFAAFSNDKFFISVESGDPKFDVNKTRQLLEKTRPEAIEVIETLEEVHS